MTAKTLSSKRLSGIHPILYAYFNKNGGLDAGAMEAQVEHCIDAGAHGIVILGVVTETAKLNVKERETLCRVVGQAVAGRVPLAATISEPSIAGQIEFANTAGELGSDWVILQAPQVAGMSQGALVDFMGTVAGGIELPVGVQNNPINMAVSLTNDSLLSLIGQQENIKILKADGTANSVVGLMNKFKDRIGVFGGQGGLEMLTQLRYGFDGIIPAPDCVAHQVRIYDLWKSGEPEARIEAARLFGEIAPLIIYMTRDLNGHQLALGKQRVANYLGQAYHGRQPCVAPALFAVDELQEIAGQINPFAFGE